MNKVVSLYAMIDTHLVEYGRVFLHHAVSFCTVGFVERFVDHPVHPVRLRYCKVSDTYLNLAPSRDFFILDCRGVTFAFFFGRFGSEVGFGTDSRPFFAFFCLCGDEGGEIDVPALWSWSSTTSWPPFSLFFAFLCRFCCLSPTEPSPPPVNRRITDSTFFDTSTRFLSFPSSLFLFLCFLPVAPGLPSLPGSAETVHPGTSNKPIRGKRSRGHVHVQIGARSHLLVWLAWNSDSS
jgi:hypothetical protein